MRSRIFLAGALPLLIAGVAGCGGGSSNASAPVVATTPAPAPLSKRALIEQGDAICAEVNAAVGTVAASSTGSGSATRATQVAQLYSGMVDRLKGLGTPEEATGYGEFVAAAEALAQAESDARLAAERGESAGLEAAEAKASSALASFQAAANAYGFEKCGEEPSAPAPAATNAGSGGEASAEEGEAAEAEAGAEEPEAAPETGGAGSVEAGGGASAGGGEAAGGGEEGGGSSGGIGPG